MIRPLSFGLLALAAVACSGDDGRPGPDAAIARDTVVFVVRHAETTNAGSDPPLSSAGQARAQALANVIPTSDLTAIYTSQYRRTRETAVAAANAATLEVQVRQVDGTNSATYGAELATLARGTPSQTVLIVGHSNTVPDTVKALTGVTIPPISETEYNRLYTITLAAEGAHLDVTTY